MDRAVDADGATELADQLSSATDEEMAFPLPISKGGPSVRAAPRKPTVFKRVCGL